MTSTQRDNRILIDPAVAFGKPVIRGTRVAVELVADLVEAGASPEEIVSDYPELSEEDVKAAVAFVAIDRARTEVRAL